MNRYLFVTECVEYEYEQSLHTANTQDDYYNHYNHATSIHILSDVLWFT